MNSYTGGMMEFEFDEATGTFQPTGKIITYIRSAVMNGDFKTAVQFYGSAQGNIGDELVEEARTSSKTFQQNLAKMFELARDFERASALYELVGNLERAGALAEQNYDFERAADCYLKAGRLEKAAQAYERDLKFKKAAQLYLKIKDFERAAQNFERAEMFMEAGELYLKLRKLKESVRAYQQVPPESTNYLEAQMRLADILYTAGQQQYALKVYHAIASRYPCNNATVKAYQRLAIGYAEVGQKDVAAKLMEKVAEVAPELSKSVQLEIAPQKAIAAENILEPLEDKKQKEEAMVGLRMGFEHVHSFPLFSKLRLEDVQEFYDLAELKKLKQGTVFIEEGQTQPYLFIILKGEVEVLKYSSDGGSTVVATLKPGQAVGELSVITGAKTTATVAAATDVVVLRIHRDNFFRFLKQEPRRAIAVYESVIATLTERLNDANRKLASLR